MRSIQISLIHNNDSERLNYIRPKIRELEKILGLSLGVNYYEYSLQPEIQNVSYATAVLRDYYYWRANRKWKKYCLVKSRPLLIDLGVLLVRLFDKYLLFRSKGLKWRKNCAVEMFVTNKHIKVIENAIEDGADYLLAFEDDAVFKDSSISETLNLFYKLNEVETPAYLDLAGGCKIEELKIDKLQKEYVDGFISYNKGVTNTACVYMMNREQLLLHYAYIVNHPYVRYIGIDWMFNVIFINQIKINSNIYCLHAHPSIFKHGSTTGDYLAWER